MNVLPVWQTAWPVCQWQELDCKAGTRCQILHGQKPREYWVNLQLGFLQTLKIESLEGEPFLKRRCRDKKRFLTYSSIVNFSCKNISPFVCHSALGLRRLSAMLPGSVNVGFDKMCSFLLEARQRPAVHQTQAKEHLQRDICQSFAWPLSNINC